MASSFERTMRSLDRPERWLVSLLLSVISICAWAAWLVLARVNVYESSDKARLEVQHTPHRASAQETGRVVAIHGRLGDVVQAGDVLVELDPGLAQAQLASDLSALATLEPRIGVLRDQLAAEQEVARSQLHMDQLASRRAGVQLAQAEAAAAHQGTLTEIAQQVDALKLSAHVDVVNAEAILMERRLDAQRAAVELQRFEAAGVHDEKAHLARSAELRRQLAELQAEQQARESAIVLAREQLARLVVRAPIDGSLGSLGAVQVGDVIKQGDVVATVIPEQHVHLVAQFSPSQAAGRVLPGQSARVRLSGFTWLEFGVLSAQVTRVAREPYEQQLRVELEIASDGRSRLPIEHGLPASVDILVDRASPWQLILRSLGSELLQPVSDSPALALGGAR